MGSWALAALVSTSGVGGSEEIQGAQKQFRSAAPSCRRSGLKLYSEPRSTRNLLTTAYLPQAMIFKSIRAHTN